MTVLMWDKPKKILTVQQWAEHYGFEDGPTGGYSPNMADADLGRWKAKITGKKLGFPQVEIRKTAGAQMTMIVNLGDGYNYKYYRAELVDDPRNADHIFVGRCGTFGQALHLALNGPMVLDHTEVAELPLVIEEAKSALNSLMVVPGDRSYYGAVMTSFDKEEFDAIAGAKFVFYRDGILLFTAPPSIIPMLKNLSGFTSLHLASDIFKEGKSLFDKDYKLPNFFPSLINSLSGIASL